MAKKVKEEKEVIEVAAIAPIDGKATIKIIKDTLHLKKGEVYTESGDVASLLVAKGIAEII
jgi:hypothetical protein